MIPKRCPIAMNKRSVLPIFLTLFFLVPSFVTADLTPGRLDTGFNVGSGADDSIYTLALEKDGSVLMGGRFTQINGFNQANFYRVEKDGSHSTFTPQVNDAVFSVAVQPDGKILIVGVFSQVNGVTRDRIARLNRDGSLDTGFVPGIVLSGLTDSIHALALQADGKIILGGWFNTGGYQNLARLNPNGSLDTGFNIGTGFNETVLAIAVQSDGRILVGGHFTLVNGVSLNRITRLNGDGSPDAGFNPGTGAENSVAVIAVQPDLKIVIGGNFQSFNGTIKKYLARLNGDGSLDTGFSPQVNNAVEDLKLLPDGRILAAGFFLSAMGCPTCQYISRFLPEGSIDPSLTPAVSGGSGVYALALQDDGGIVIAGNFTAMNLLTSQKNLARLNPDGTVDSGFSLANVDGWVWTAAVDGWGKVCLGGYFSTYYVLNPPGIFIRNSIIRLNMDGSIDTTFDPKNGVNGWVFALALTPDRRLYLGGAFTQVDNTPYGGIARLNPDGSLDGTFNTLGVDTGGSVGALALQSDQKLVVGGVFNKMSVYDRKNLARLASSGAVDTGFIADTDKDVLALALQDDGRILVGGKFTQVNGVTRTYLARLNPDGSPDGSFNPTLNNEVWAIQIQPDGKIYIGGLFTLVNGEGRSGIARLLPNGDLDSTFNPGSGTIGPVAGIARQRDGRIVIGGLFSTFNGISRSGIARLNSNGLLDSSFDPGTGAGAAIFPNLPGIRTILAQENGRVLIGGPFDQYNGTPRYFVGRLNGQSAVAFTGLPPVTAELGKPFYHLLQATGFPSPRFQVTSGALPPGITLGRYAGILSGIPQQVGAFNFTISAYNQFPPEASQALTLTVDQAHLYLPLLLR